MTQLLEKTTVFQRTHHMLAVSSESLKPFFITLASMFLSSTSSYSRDSHDDDDDDEGERLAVRSVYVAQSAGSISGNRRRKTSPTRPEM